MSIHVDPSQTHVSSRSVAASPPTSTATCLRSWVRETDRDVDATEDGMPLLTAVGGRCAEAGADAPGPPHVTATTVERPAMSVLNAHLRARRRVGRVSLTEAPMWRSVGRPRIIPAAAELPSRAGREERTVGEPAG